jgi:hypothetical protein
VRERVGASLRGPATQFREKERTLHRHNGRKVLGGEGGEHTNAACILDEELHCSVVSNSDRTSSEGLAAKGC